jgi:hypothetical protein
VFAVARQGDQSIADVAKRLGTSGRFKDEAARDQARSPFG